jgi:hypothetical protein
MALAPAPRRHSIDMMFHARPKTVCMNQSTGVPSAAAFLPVHLTPGKPERGAASATADGDELGEAIPDSALGCRPTIAPWWCAGIADTRHRPRLSEHQSKIRLSGHNGKFISDEAPLNCRQAGEMSAARLLAEAGLVEDLCTVS